MQPWMRGSSYDPCTESHSTVYYNRPEVQRALHANVTAGAGAMNYTWATCRCVCVCNELNAIATCMREIIMLLIN
jgi:hypothetical protein